MTLQLAVFASSLAGAILFFFGGYLMARSSSAWLPRAEMRQHPPGHAFGDPSSESPRDSAPSTDDASADPELDALRNEIATYRNRLAEAEEERDRISRLNKELQQHLETQNTGFASASSELDALRHEIALSRDRLAEAERERSRILGLEEEIRQGLEARNKLESENRRFQEEWQEKAGQVDSLRDEKSDLKRRLDQAVDENDLLSADAGLLKETQKERKELTIRLESLNRHVSELERYREESARLTALVEEVPHLRDKIDRLKEENRELRSLGLVYEPPAEHVHAMPTDFLGGSMQNLLEGFATSKGARGAALSDDHGLLVAGTGEHAEGLAVTGALCEGFVKQVSDILPLGSLRQLIIVDTNAVTAAIYPFRAGSDQLMLASLSVGLRPGSKAIDDFVRQASRLVDGRQAQSA